MSLAEPLAARFDGPEGAPVVVLLHAIATNSELWSAQVAVWSRHFRLVRLDLPGHGASAPLKPGADFEAFAGAVAQTLDAHQITSAAVVGLSFGAMIGLRLAVERPDLVRASVFANGLVKTPEPVRDAWRSRIAAVETGGMASQSAMTLDRWFTPEFAARSSLTVDWVRTLIETTPAVGFQRAADAISRLDQTELLARVSTPSLVLAGQFDLAAPAVAGQALAEALPDATLAILETAHLSCVEQPVAFTETVGAFLHATKARAG